MKPLFYISICSLVLASCGGPDEGDLAGGSKSDSSYTVEANHLAVKTQAELTDAKGIIGIFYVPEMLTVAKVDSASVKNVPERMSKGYDAVFKDIELMKAKRYGSAGAIYYNNDTGNFVFECVVPIQNMPEIKPKNSQVVVLEEGKMLIYNYYGSYAGLDNVYNEIRAYCTKYKLEQAGPIREFYITDATTQPDENQWLTRVMLPVN